MGNVAPHQSLSRKREVPGAERMAGAGCAIGMADLVFFSLHFSSVAIGIVSSRIASDFACSTVISCLKEANLESGIQKLGQACSAGPAGRQWHEPPSGMEASRPRMFDPLCKVEPPEGVETCPSASTAPRLASGEVPSGTVRASARGRCLIGRGARGVMRDHQKPAKYGQSRLM